MENEQACFSRSFQVPSAPAGVQMRVDSDTHTCAHEHTHVCPLLLFWYICVCMNRFLCTCVYMFVEARGQPWVSFLDTVHHFGLHIVSL